MFSYVVKRILIFIPTLLIISIVIFMLSVFAPGDPVEKMLGATPEGEPIPPEAYNETRKELGLDLPVFYFSLTAKAYPDTIYRVPIKAQRENMNRLISLYGNWPQIDKYQKIAKVLQGSVQAIEKDSLNPRALIRMKENVGNLFLRYEDKDIQKAFRNFEEHAQSTPSTAAVMPLFNQVRQAYADVQEQATPGKLKIPTIHWFGLKNQYHRWLMGNRPLFLKKEKMASLDYTLVQSKQHTFSVPKDGYYSFNIKVPASTVKRSSENAEILYIRTSDKSESKEKVAYRNIVDGKHKTVVPLKAGETIMVDHSIGMIKDDANTKVNIHYYPKYDPSWSSGFLRFDFGKSYEDKRPIREKIGDYIFWTMLISTISIILTYLISVPLGVFSARRKGSRADGVVTTILFILYSLPSFWVATLLIIFFCQPDYLNWFPPYGLGEVTSETPFFQKIGIRAYHLILPLFCWTYGGLAFLSRQMRGGMLSVLRQDYVRTARAKGLEEKKVIWKHAFRNSLLPIITLFANIFPLMISGAIVIEIIFTIPGMGRLLFEAIKYPDDPMVFTIVMMAALLTMIGYLIADILYAVVDPRITFN
ncbi:MAG: ABC transporter permease subunit [Bacteroidota bacterium]